MRYKALLSILTLTYFTVLNGQNTPIDSIPFHLEKDHRIYTHVKVNASDSLYFLIDTGASDMVINTSRLNRVQMEFDSAVDNLGTTGTNSVQKSSTNTLQWGQQTIDNTAFISIPYPPNTLWDGVLGLSVLRQFVVHINYDKMKIYLYDKDSYACPNEGQALKIDYVHRVPTVELTVTTKDRIARPLKMEIDLGSDRIVDISTSYVNLNKLLEVYTTAFAVSNIKSSDGNTGTIYNVFFPEIEMGGYHFYNIPGGVAQIQHGLMNSAKLDGMLGNWFLKRFNLTFDFKHDTLSLTPNNLLYTPFYEFLLPK